MDFVQTWRAWLDVWFLSEGKDLQVFTSASCTSIHQLRSFAGQSGSAMNQALLCRPFSWVFSLALAHRARTALRASSGLSSAVSLAVRALPSLSRQDVLGIRRGDLFLIVGAAHAHRESQARNPNSRLHGDTRGAEYILFPPSDKQTAQPAGRPRRSAPRFCSPSWLSPLIPSSVRTESGTSGAYPSRPLPGF